MALASKFCFITLPCWIEHLKNAAFAAQMPLWPVSHYNYVAYFEDCLQI